MYFLNALFLLITPLFILGQSLTIYPLSSIIESDNAMFELSTEMTITNSSLTTIDVKISKHVISEINGTENYFCWDYCNLPTTDVSPNSIAIQSNQSNDSSLTVHYSPNGMEGETLIKYCAFDLNNHLDSSCTNIMFKIELPYVWLCIDGTCIDTLLYRESGFSTLDECLENCFEPTFDCINNNCIEITDGSGSYYTMQDCENVCTTSSILESKESIKQVKKIIDFYGRKIQLPTNMPVIKIYEDGSIEKAIVFD